MEKKDNALQQAYNQWEKNTLSKSLDIIPERKHISEKRIYTPLDIEITPENYMEKVGFPGQYPMTRGGQATMYRGKLWTMRSYAGFSTADETNTRFKYLIEQGATGLSVAFDLPTQIGYDSDDYHSEGDVGKVGVAIDSLEDMEQLFYGIPLDKVSTSMTINAPAIIMLAMYQAVGEKQGIKPEQLRGTVQNDILKEYVARGTYIYPPKPSMRLVSDLFVYCKNNIPNWNTISLGGYHIREAGSTVSQELAFSFANAIAYIQSAIDAGLDIDEFAGRISWIFTASINIFEETAKFRAARRLWAKILKERFGAKKPSSWKLRVHVHTAGSTLTAQQPLNNIVRVTLQALAGVLGGVNSMATCAFDEALSIPTEESATLAMRTQQIIAYESGISEVIDPLGGSYYVEALTNKIELEAEQIINQIEEMGGAVVAIEKGWMQREILKSAYDYQKSIESNEQTIVGINKYVSKEKTDIKLTPIDPRVRQIQSNKIVNLKKRRDNAAVKSALSALGKAAEGTENLYPYILNAVRVYATEGEICNVLRVVFGEYLTGSIF